MLKLSTTEKNEFINAFYLTLFYQNEDARRFFCQKANTL